jgi:hypothetical protein
MKKENNDENNDSPWLAVMFIFATLISLAYYFLS